MADTVNTDIEAEVTAAENLFAAERPSAVAAYHGYQPAEKIAADLIAAEKPAQPPTVLDQAIRLASIQGIDKDMFDRIMAANEREMAMQAKERFNEAMNRCKAEIAPIARTSENKQTGSWWAKLEAVDAAIRPTYTKYGFNVSYGTDAPLVPGNVRVFCEIALGRHAERFYLEAPADTLGPKGTPTKTALHGIGSTFTYLSRYCLVRAFNVHFKGVDDDGNAGGAAFIDQQQAAQLQALIDETETNPAAFFRTMVNYEVLSYPDVNVLDFDRLMNTLRNKKRLQSRGEPG